MKQLLILVLFLLVGYELAAQKLAIRDPYGSPAIHQLAFSPDGQVLYATDAFGHVLRIPLGTGVLELLDDQHTLTVRAMDREGNLLVTADGNQVINYWDATTGKHVYQIPAPPEAVDGFLCLDLESPSGPTLLGTAAELVLVKPADPPVLERTNSHEFIKAVAYDDRGAWAAVSYGDRRIELISRLESEEYDYINNQKTYSYDLDFRPNSRELAFTDGRRMGIAETGMPLRTRYSEIRFFTTLYSLQFSPDGRTIAVGDGRGEVYLVDVQTDSLLFRVRPDELAINDLVFSPDGRLLATADAEGIHWIDIEQQKVLAYTTTTDDSNGYIHMSPDDFYDANPIGLDYLKYFDTAEKTFLERPTNDPMLVEGLLPRLLAGEEFAVSPTPSANNSTVPSTPTSPANWNRAGKDRALFFAVDDYTEWPDLRNPVSDVEALASDLSERYGFMTEVVRNPSKRTIYDKLEEYRQLTYADDAQLLIFFSGHGAFNEGTEEGFLVPREGLLKDAYQESYIPHSRLAPRVDNIPCPHILLAIDACYSGTFDQRLSTDRGQPGSRPGDSVDARQAFVSRMLRDRSRLYLTSGGKERTPDGDRHSPFAEYWLRALRSYGGEDSILTFFELTAMLEQAEPRPRFGPFGSHDIGGGFLFLVK